MNICPYIYVSIQIHIYVFANTFMYICIVMNSHIHICICTYTHTNICTLKYIFICIHEIHTHTRKRDPDLYIHVLIYPFTLIQYIYVHDSRENPDFGNIFVESQVLQCRISERMPLCKLLHNFVARILDLYSTPTHDCIAILIVQVALTRNHMPICVITHCVTLAKVSCTRTCMRWLRLVGSLKAQVSFAEYRLFHRALLQKRPVILSSLRIEATPQSFHKCE